MPVFSYKALGNDGTVSTGEVDAADRTEALRMLERRGMQPVSLRQSSSAMPANKQRNGRKPGKESSGKAGVGSPRVNAATFFLETNYLSLEMYSCDFISISELKCKLKGGVPRKNGHFGLKIIPYWCTAWYRFRAENFKY